MPWKPWRALRERDDVDVALVDLPPGIRAVLATDGDLAVIMLDRSLSPADRLAALAHELVHLERAGSGWEPGMPDPLRCLVSREEETVEREVADRLVPLAVLERFARTRAEVEPVTVDVVADEFGVPVHVAERQLRRLVG